jgi:hypothetical protein
MLNKRINGTYKITKKALVLFSIFCFLNLMFLPDSVFAKDQEDSRFWDTDTMIGVLIVLPIVISIFIMLGKKRSSSSKMQFKNEDKDHKTISSKNKYIEQHFSLRGEQVVFQW